MSRRSRRLVLIMLLGAAAPGGCGTDVATGDPPPAVSVPTVGVVTIQPQRAVLTAELPGRTLPYAVSEVRPQVSGILQARRFVEGSRVEAGEVLYQIDATPYQAAYDRAAAQLESAKAALTTARLLAERTRSLREHSSVSQQDFDDAQAALQQAEAAVAEREAAVVSARIDLDYTSIKAPITGKIGRSYLTPGALVTANQDESLATIQTLDPIYVDINQSNSELLALKKAISGGQMSDQGCAAVTLMLDHGIRYPHEGTLKFSEVMVDPTTGTVTLRAEFPNPDGVLLPGMFVRATIVEGIELDALLVPQRGVGRDERGDATALIVDAEGIVQSRKLTVARPIGSSWLVTGGIDAGDRVIVEGLQHVRPGQHVNVVPFEAPADGAAAPADDG